MPVTISTNKNWSDYEATSTSSVAVATGTLNFTIETGKAWVATDEIALVPTAAKIPMMLIGTVSSYDSGTGALVVSINRFESGIPSWDLVSSSTHTVGTGSKTFQTYNSKSSQLATSDSVIIARRAAQAGNRMAGSVTSYNNATGELVVNVTSTLGSGTNQIDWIIVSGGTFSAWDITPAPIAQIFLSGFANLTFDMEPKYPIGSLVSTSQGKFICNNNTNNLWSFNLSSKVVNAQKLFQIEINGEANFTGGKIQIATGTGVAGQTIDLSSYTKLDMPAIEVETGSGTGIYRPWYIFENDNNLNRGYTGLNWFSRAAKFNFNTETSSVVTMTTATPTVVSWTAHGLKIGQRVQFTSTGSMTGVALSTPYYVLAYGYTADSFQIGSNQYVTTGVALTAQSGTHTCYTMTDFGNGDQGNILLYNPVTKILTCGDGTRGNVIPNGAKVRMPNIQFTMEYPRTCINSAISSATAGNAVTFVVGAVLNLVVAGSMTFGINGEEFTGTFTGSSMTTASRANFGTVAANHAQGDTLYNIIGTTSRGTFDTADGGKLAFDTVSFSGVYLNPAGFQTVSLTDVWICGGCSIGSTTGSLTVNGLYNSNYAPLDNPTASINTMSGPLDVRKFYSAAVGFGQNAAPQATTLASNQNIIRCEDLEGYATHRNGSATPAVVYFNVNAIRCTPKRIKVIGGRLLINSSSNFEMENISVGAECNGIASTAMSMNAIGMINCQNAILRTIGLTTGGVPHRTYLLTTDANCSNVLVHTINYDGQDHLGGISQFIGNNIRVVNGNFGALRDTSSSTLGSGALTNSSTSDSANVQNCIYTLSDSYSADNGIGVSPRSFVEYCTGFSSWWRATTAFASNFQEIGPFYVLLDNGKATGTLCLIPSVKASRDIYDLGGATAYFDNSGSLLLPTSGDYAIIKSYQVLRTITGFTGAVDPEDVNNANLTYEFELVNYDGTFTNTWTSLTTANLNSALTAITGYNNLKGFHLRIKITAIATLATNRVINVRMFTTNNDSADLPIGYTDYTINNLQGTCTTIGVFAGSEEEDYDLCVTTSNTSKLPYDFDGNYSVLDVKVRSLTHTWDDHSVSYNQNPLSYTSKQEVDPEVTETDVAVVSAYTSLDTIEKIYDYAKYWGSLRANLLVDLVCTKSGDTLDFGSYDVEFDATAASVFSKSGNKIIIKGSVT